LGSDTGEWAASGTSPGMILPCQCGHTTTFEYITQSCTPWIQVPVQSKLAALIPTHVFSQPYFLNTSRQVRSQHPRTAHSCSTLQKRHQRASQRHETHAVGPPNMLCYKHDNAGRHLQLSVAALAASAATLLQLRQNSKQTQPLEVSLFKQPPRTAKNGTCSSLQLLSWRADNVSSDTFCSAAA
jgi:hypothetical protein